ncbi:hypothetical protein WICMUC_001087 [Wickerhamomyces mucosus]|uniref:Uncharacterized protein n=1 Tax=Wickerhamomyces mucosus TaxID=1378264 RepID=A0A9P8PXF4_9ASCO|nr:hypothetical protein WICMUC_001087 [Wickerhamomyces mucosus]
MELLKKRLQHLNHIVDYEITPTDENRSIRESLILLNNEINNHINNNDGLKKLINNLNNYKLRYNDIEEFDDIDSKAQFIDAKLEDLTQLTTQLSRIQELKNFKNDVSIETVSQRDLQRITDLELYYNYLLIKSIQLFKNYLQVLNKFNKTRS